MDYAEVLREQGSITPEQETALLSVRGIDSVLSAHPQPLPLGQLEAGSIRARQDQSTDSLFARGFHLVELPEGPVTISLAITSGEPGTSNLDLELQTVSGEGLGHSSTVNGVGGTEQIQRTVPAGQYVVVVYGCQDNPLRLNDADYTAVVTAGGSPAAPRRRGW